jgi:hypothetical protein
MCLSVKPYLQFGENGISTRDLEDISNPCQIKETMRSYRNLAGALLVLSIDDLAILIEDHGPATVAVAHTSVPSVFLGEEGLGVAEEELHIVNTLITNLCIVYNSQDHLPSHH